MKPYFETRLGQLYHGDCVEISKHFKPETFDLIIADPPYALPAMSACSKKLVSPWPDLMNYASFLTLWMKESFRVVRKNGALWIFCNWKSFPAVSKATCSIGSKVESLLVWDKKLLGPGTFRGLRPAYEMVALICKPDFKIKNRSLRDIQVFNWMSTKPSGHPAEKPKTLIRWLIEISNAHYIGDFFLGSGTTAIVCEELGLNWTGIEMNEHYCKLSMNRVQKEIKTSEVEV